MSQFIRAQTPPVYTDHLSYRPFLRIDFRERCAYCERTEVWLGGTDFFTVDHFRPRSKFPELSFHYPNLYYACGKCNQHKANTWPNENLSAKGFRLSDPCEEDMYSEHLRELEEGTLESLDNCGRYTCDHIRLNRPDLSQWRRLRRQIAIELNQFEAIKETLQRQLARTANPAEVQGISMEVALIETTVKRHRAQLGLTLTPPIR